MTGSAPGFAALTGGLPPAPQVPAAAVAEARARAGSVMVVIDDDPTGTQTVAGVPLISRWTVADLEWGLTRGAPCLFVLANTRSLGAAAAQARVREITAAAHAASEATGVPYVVVSRGDSTLRGHFPGETDAIGEELAARTGRGPDLVLLCPAYIEAGRVTAGDVHWARTGRAMVPVGETPYAADATFGYTSSDLPSWVQEKSGGRIAAADVVTLGLEEIRGGDPGRLAGRLLAARGGAVVVVNALCDEDLRVVALAALEAEARGCRILYRTGPSFVRALAGLEARPPLEPEGAGAGGHGLVVVGSHVPLTSRQLDRLLEDPGVEALEIPVPDLLAAADAEPLLESMVKRARAILERRDAVLYTSRQVVGGEDPDAALAASVRVSGFLVAITRRIVAAGAPAFVVGKGGITSSDLASEGLDIRRATVAGSLLPGLVSVWRAVDGPMAALPYVVFAGNVGEDDSLLVVVRKLRGGIAC